jgi:DNA-binding IclR family transcriptional regulator
LSREDLKNRILAALALHDSTVAQLAELLAEKKSKIRRVLNALQNERKVIRFGWRPGIVVATIWSSTQMQLELERERETTLRNAVRETEPNLQQLERERWQ